ncbi:MAG: hypothetical protein ACK5SM_02010, partial [Sphingomonadales bacterium]
LLGLSEGHFPKCRRREQVRYIDIHHSPRLRAPSPTSIGAKAGPVANKGKMPPYWQSVCSPIAQPWVIVGVRGLARAKLFVG